MKSLMLAVLAIVAMLISAVPATAAEQGVDLSLPNGFSITPTEYAQIELRSQRRAHPECLDCVVVSYENLGIGPAEVTLRLMPLMSPVSSDRSFGAWVYRYVREHIQRQDEVSLAEPNVTEKVVGLGSRTRFHLRAASFSGHAVSYLGGSFRVTVSIPPGEVREFVLYDGVTTASAIGDSRIKGFLYWSLWSPFRWLCLTVERLIDRLLPSVGVFGLVLLVVLLVRTVTFPINRWSFRSQQTFETVQREIAPELAELKSRLKGADQSEAVLELYQSRNINPLSGLKGSVGLFVQIPILVAMFNVASDSAILDQVPMGWIDNVALPEQSIDWGIDIPLLGRFLNPLALTLAAVMLASEMVKTQRSVSSIGFAVVVGVLLYSFPAFLVAYWFLITIAQNIEQILVRNA